MNNLYILVFGILFVCPNVIFAQNYAVGHKSTAYLDPARANRQIDCEIYYPATAAGDNQPFVPTSEGKFPVIVFGHGFVMAWSAYQNIWENLVPQGFILVFPRTEGNIAPSHEQFGKDLAFMVNKMGSENLLTSSFFFDRVAPLKAVMGHSMGGGAAFLAAAQNPDISAILTLAPAETNPSAIAAAGNLTIPALILSGANDCVTAPATNTLPMYEALQSSCKTLVNIIGASHCQMADSNFFCGVGEGTCSPAPTIDRDQQHIVINRYIGKWLKNNLKADCPSGISFDSTIAADNGVTFQKNCLQCEELSTVGFSSKNIFAVPNPFSNGITFELGNRSGNVKLYDAFGRKILELEVNGNGTVSTENLASGVYFCTISENGKIIGREKLLKN